MFAVARIVAATAIVGLATVASVTNHISGDAFVAVVGAALGYIFGMGDATAGALVKRKG